MERARRVRIRFIDLVITGALLLAVLGPASWHVDAAGLLLQHGAAGAPAGPEGAGGEFVRPALRTESRLTDTPPTMGREMAPVIVQGAALPHLSGAPTDDLFVYAYGAGGYAQIPFQVDEMVGGTYTSTVGSPLDDEDELVFMASDLGGRPDTEDLTATLPISDTWYRLEVTDPLSPTAKGWAYVVRSSSLTQTFTQTYTSFITGTGHISTTAYSVGFLDGHPGLDVLEMNGSGEDILDRTKIRATIFGNPITEEAGLLASPDPDPIKGGPVRVIVQNRGVIGYRSIFQTLVNVTAPALVSAARLSTDFTSQASGATFYNAVLPGGATVDGNPTEAVPETPLSPWWQVSDDTGTLVQVADSSGVGGTRVNYYKDDDTFDGADTGDGKSYGDTGISVTSPNMTITYIATFWVMPPGPHKVGDVVAYHAAHPLQVTAIAPSTLVHDVYLPLALKN